MANPQGNDGNSPYENPPSPRQERERRAQARNNSVLARIEDTTYEILRKHEKKLA
jgi:hypothetical protein